MSINLDFDKLVQANHTTTNHRATITSGRREAYISAVSRPLLNRGVVTRLDRDPPQATLARIARCSFGGAGIVGSVWSPSGESRARLKREQSWERRRTAAVWIAGIGAALAYWALMSMLISWDQLGEILGLLTVVPIAMIVGHMVGNRMDRTHRARAARDTNEIL